MAAQLQRVRDAVVPHQCEHIPSGPAWVCVGCGQRWPCRPYKEIVWAANRGRPELVAVIMAEWMDVARWEIRLSVAEYRSRFVEWIYRWPRP